MKKLYFSLQKKLFGNRPHIFKIYKRYLENHDNLSMSGRIKSYFFLSVLIIKDFFHLSMKKEMNIYNPSVYYIQCERKGKINQDKVFYCIERNESGEGFIAILRTLLYATAFAEKFNMIPVMTISQNSKYFQKGGYNGINNPFEYFFVQPGGVSVEEAMHSAMVVTYKEHHLGIVNDFPIENPYHHSNEFIAYCSFYYKKYFKLRKEIYNKINLEIDDLLKNEKVLGIHFRGGDFAKNYDNHPKMVRIEDYYKIIDKAIKEYEYKKIFVATDDKNALKKIKARYSNIINYSDVLRTNNAESVMNLESDRSNNQFLLGYEVLRDMYTLASCDGIISGVSMVNIFARIVRKSMGYEYEFDKYIDKGINNNLKDYNDVMNSLKKRNGRGKKY